MTGQDWLQLIRANRQSILDQMRPHWDAALDNRRSGVEVLLYLEDNGTVSTLTRTTGSNNWRQGDYLLPLGNSNSTRPGAYQTEDDIINNIISNNVLYDW